MKRYLALIVISALIQGSALVGCASNQNIPIKTDLSQAGEKVQPPQAEASPKDVEGAGKSIILGFYTDNGMSSKNSVVQNIKTIDELAFFWYSFNGSGTVIRSNNGNLSLKDTAQKSGAKVYALVSNMTDKGFDSQLAHQVLANSAIRTKFISNLVNLAVNEKWDGISVDIEKAFPNDRVYYSSFIAELHQAMKEKGKILNVCLPSKYHDYKPDLWSGAYDYAAIGKIADQVVLMTYEEHGVGTTQGPIASQGWVNRVVKFAVTQIPKEKIIMGLPVYANEWMSNKPLRPDAMSIPDAVDLAGKHKVDILFDEGQQAPHYSFTDGGVRHEVYLENTRSLTFKVNIAKRYQLRGIAIWRLGLEDPSLWNKVLRNY